jgi:hypothetical protein
MTGEAFGWESLLLTSAPSTCALRRALLTSYDRPDARFLVEHLLPVLLRLNREPESDGIERQYFFAELTHRLEALHGQLTVVSSMSHTDEVDQDYPWLWRFVRPLSVGSTGKATQHAKLWMFHWATENDDQEYVELVISSANLTLSAFKGQIQGAWRVCLPLAARGSRARRDGWGMLPTFLQELGKACNDAASITWFVELLGRADCPVDARFVASAPGMFSRDALKKTPWGAAGLRVVAPPGKGSIVASVLVPYVGTWSTVGLARWCGAFGGKPSDIKLVWIDRDHPWARSQCWVLPKTTLRVLEQVGCEISHLHFESDEGDDHVARFHAQHRGADVRWSHAKVYQFRRGRSYRLLITSANFSEAAWGRSDGQGGLTIENFELGVCVQGEEWPFGSLGAFADVADIATIEDRPARSASSLTWASATWDGKRVHVECRVAHAKLDVEGSVSAAERRQAILRWKAGAGSNLMTSDIPWLYVTTPPQTVRLTCNDETLLVPVFDTRPRSDRKTTPTPEVAEAYAELMRDELLFEQYGGGADSDSSDLGTDAGQLGLAPDDNVDSGDFDDVELDGDTGVSDSYAVATFEQARRAFEIVDTWATRMDGAGEHSEATRDQRLLREDGEALLGAFERQAVRLAAKGATMVIGPRLATEELRLRLKHVEVKS